MAWLLHWLLAVIHALALESPGSKPVLEILEGLETLGSSHDLGRVVSSEESVWALAHFFRCNTETNQSSVNDSVVLQGPQVMELLLFHILVRRKTKNTVGVVA